MTTEVLEAAVLRQALLGNEVPEKFIALLDQMDLFLVVLNYNTEIKSKSGWVEN